MLVHGSLFGDQTVYSCEEGYVIDSGNDTITCLDTGFWSNGSFVCRVYGKSGPGGLQHLDC